MKTKKWEKALERIRSNEKMLRAKGIGLSTAKSMCPHDGFLRAWKEYKDLDRSQLWRGRNRPKARCMGTYSRGPRGWLRIEREIERMGGFDHCINPIRIARILCDKGMSVSQGDVIELLKMRFGRDKVAEYKEAEL